MTLDEREKSAIARLTENEKDCLRRCLAPQTAKEMAIDLGVSPHAVEKRLKMARAKLGLSSSLAAARLLAAAESGYGQPVPRLSDLPDTHPAQQIAGAATSRRLAFILVPGVLLMSLALATLIAAALQTAPAVPPSKTTISPARLVTSGEPAGKMAMRAASPEEVHRFLADSFTLMDRDHSGFIERAEAPIMGVGRPHPRGQAPQKPEPVTWLHGKAGQAVWMARVDADDDGKVTRDEYIAFSLPAFSSRGVPVNWKPRS